MSDAITAISIAMQNDLIQLNSISQNVSNLNSVAFKRNVTINPSMDFNKLLQKENMNSDSLSSLLTDATANVITDWSQGKVKNSNNPMNIALEGDVYLQIFGANSNSLTRNGELVIDLQGRLTLSTGEPLMGESGEIFLNPGAFKIDKSGGIFQDGRNVDRLSVVSITNNNDLENMGSGIYKVSSEQALNKAENFQVLQGYIEQSNVIVSDEMIRLMELTRHFELSQKVLRSYDQMIGDAVSEIADF